MRYLKGHGRDYAFDAGTWNHYRTYKLNKMQLFKVGRVGIEEMVDTYGSLLRRSGTA